MALTLTNYTSFAIVRGLLGVAEAEIEDDIFTTMSNTFLQEVTFALEDVNLTLPSMFETVDAIDPNTRTVAQARFYEIVKLYAGYTVADRIANGAVEMFAPIKITDGKAEQDRKDDPYVSLRLALKASLTLWRFRMGTALNALDSAQVANITSPTLVGSVGTAVDPVTGA